MNILKLLQQWFKRLNPIWIPVSEQTPAKKPELEFPSEAELDLAWSRLPKEVRERGSSLPWRQRKEILLNHWKSYRKEFPLEGNNN